MLENKRLFVLRTIQYLHRGKTAAIPVIIHYSGQYIHYTSNVAPNIKASVISALTRRTKLVCTKNDYLASIHKENYDVKWLS